MKKEGKIDNRKKVSKEGERWGEKNRTKRTKTGRQEDRRVRLRGGGRILRRQFYSVPASSCSG
jgi:hypothetical protein